MIHEHHSQRISNPISLKDHDSPQTTSVSCMNPPSWPFPIEAPRSPPTAPKEKKATHTTPKSEKAIVIPDPDTVLTVEFGKYSSILKRVERLADEEMRLVELQVIYMVKHDLDTLG
jgi:hypothetical protein